MGVEALLNNKLSSLSSKPLYIQLIARIKELIISEDLVIGDLLPSEPELCEKLNISRSTVRQSLASLESEGYIVRRRGKGTYVSKPKVKRVLSRLCSFTKHMDELGMTCASKVLEMTVLSSKDVSGFFGVPEDIYKIVRLRQMDGQPFMIDTVYVPVKMVPKLTKKDLADKSLYDVIEEKTGTVPAHAHESYEVVKLRSNEVKLLMATSETAFLVKRISKLASGELFEISSMLIRGDRCRLEAILESDNIAFSRTVQS